MTTFFDDAEPELWSRVRTGDPAAFGELFDAFRDRVYWHALRHTRVASDAEDVTALVFLEAWRKRPQVRIVDGSQLPWLLALPDADTDIVDRARSLRPFGAFVELLTGDTWMRFRAERAGIHMVERSRSANERADHHALIADPASRLKHQATSAEKADPPETFSSPPPCAAPFTPRQVGR